MTDIFALHGLKLLYLYENNLLPVYFRSLCQLHSDNHVFATRYIDNFQIPVIRHDFARNSIRYSIPITYNKCPNLKKTIFHTVKRDSVIMSKCSLLVIMMILVLFKIVIYVKEIDLNFNQ